MNISNIINTQTSRKAHMNNLVNLLYDSGCRIIFDCAGAVID